MILVVIVYIVGNKFYGYVGFGDLLVFLFFGLFGVFGSFFLYIGYIEWSLLLLFLGCGLLVVVVLNVNNMCDIENDV